tara:strand:+ start:4596 stop:5075 length:480 start_codon:yes stop_codon:yes gene_type:complete
MEKVRKFTNPEFSDFLSDELLKISDLELVILKGHIFTEFALNCYLESISTNNSSNFFKENFSYNIKLKLLSHFGEFSGDRELLISAFKILNKLRNTIAHSLTINKQLLAEFIAKTKEIGIDNKLLEKVKTEPFYQFILCISYLCGIIFGSYVKIRNEKN